MLPDIIIVLFPWPCITVSPRWLLPQILARLLWVLNHECANFYLILLSYGGSATSKPLLFSAGPSCSLYSTTLFSAFFTPLNLLRPPITSVLRILRPIKLTVRWSLCVPAKQYFTLKHEVAYGN